MKESVIQHQILSYLGHIGVFCYRSNTGGARLPGKGGRPQFVRFGVRGHPDIVAVYDGKYVGIEVKSEKGRQTKYQRWFQEDLEEAGGVYLLARSVEDIEEYFS
ncbi:MAG: VRR-NUC domain-containing protein [Nitrospinales bacterium]